MKMSDLKTGWKVDTRNGNTYIISRDCETVYYGHQDVVLINADGSGFVCGSHYNNGLENRIHHHFDIVRVYEMPVEGDVFSGAEKGRLVWERKKNENVREMTVSEIEKELGYQVKIVG